MEPSVNIIYPPHSRQAGSELEAELSTSPFSRSFRRRNLLKLRHRYMRRSNSINSSDSSEGRIPSHTPGPEVPATENNSRYAVHSGQSAVRANPSHEVLSRRRHLMEARGALNFPPVATLICLVNVLCFYFREKFGFYNVEDVYVSWQHVWVDGQYWRLIVAQFFHFNTLQMIINSGTLFTIGRYLERKVTFVAMLAVILVMSALSQMIYILIHPYCCENKPHVNDYVYGFGNIIYSLRVLLAYALEPRNYERDLVFGLYPMVVSASHAPWQPVLDLCIFKFVLPELCITGQLAGVAAGFLLTGILLLWPTKGIYIANPPYYWTLMGTSDPSEGRGEENEENEANNEEEFWKILTYTDTSFLLPTPSGSVSAMAPPPESPPTNNHQSRVPSQHYGKREGRKSSSAPFVKPFENSMMKKSDEFKRQVSKILSHPVESFFELVAGISGNSNSKQGKQRQHHENKLRRSNPTEFLHRRSKSMLSGSSLDASLTADRNVMSSVEEIRRRNGNTVIDDMNTLEN